MKLGMTPTRLLALSLLIVSSGLTLRRASATQQQNPCRWIEDAQSTIIECLDGVICGEGGEYCCTKERQALNWKRCTLGGEDKKGISTKKLYTYHKRQCGTNGCELVEVYTRSSDYEWDCHTVVCP